MEGPMYNWAIRAALIAVCAFSAWSQQQEPPAAKAPDPVVERRVFGVLPNYRTAEETAVYEPIPAKRKFWIASKDSFDYPVYFLAGAFAALYQLEDASP